MNDENANKVNQVTMVMTDSMHETIQDLLYQFCCDNMTKEQTKERLLYMGVKMNLETDWIGNKAQVTYASNIYQIEV